MTGELRSYVDMKKEVPLLPGESPWTEEPGGLQSMGSQRVRQDLVTKTTTKISGGPDGVQFQHQVGVPQAAGNFFQGSPGVVF